MGMPDLDEEQSAQMEKELKRTEAIIDSMTREERADHRILNASRRRRIARGSGVNVSEVNALVKQYVEMRGMMKQLSGAGLFGGGGGGGMKGRMMRKLGGMMGMPDMSGLMGGGDGEGGMNLPALPPVGGAAGGNGRKKLRKKPRHKKRK
jgi:signal recognition particle subunit SRP54